MKYNFTECELYRAWLCVTRYNRRLIFNTTIDFYKAHNQQDVFETPDPPTADEAKKYEDDSKSEAVDKLECGVGKSYDTFKGKAVDNQNTGN